MVKKIIVLALALLPLGAMAQDKIAYFDGAAATKGMPELQQIQDSLAKTQEALKAEAQEMQLLYAQKLEAYQKEQATLVESIKKRRVEDLQQEEAKIYNFQQQSQEELQALADKLYMPVQQKMQAAIEAVGAANNFLYIIDVQALRYKSPTAVDATPLIRKQLGLQ